MSHQHLPAGAVQPVSVRLRPQVVARAAEPSRPAAVVNPSPPDLGFADAGALHRLLRSLQSIGNEVRLRFLDALRAFHDSNLCFELGYSSYAQYCDRELGLARSTSLEYVRVARALDGVPRLRALFGQGELSWEQVRAVTRVASAGTEIAWIELAFAEPVPVLLAEVREAQRTGRDAPRDRRYGLPNLMVRLCLHLTLEDKERVRAAFEIISSGPGPDLGGGPGDGAPRDPGVPGLAADPRPPLVRWADGILSGAIPAWPVEVDGQPESESAGALGAAGGEESEKASRDTGGQAGVGAGDVAGAEAGPGAGTDGMAGRGEYTGSGLSSEPAGQWGNGTTAGTSCGPAGRGGPRAAAPARRAVPAQTILYRTCPECRETTLCTAEGPLRVAPERVAELAPVSNRVVLGDGDALRPAVTTANSDVTADDGTVPGAPEANRMPAGALDAPNSARLTRLVLHRDGLQCANPGCGRRRNLQAHHIVFRSLGGRSVLSNEVALCDVCHALVHQGLLDITGTADGRLQWRRLPLAVDVKVRDATALRDKLDALETALAGAQTAARGCTNGFRAGTPASTDSDGCHSAAVPPVPWVPTAADGGAASLATSAAAAASTAVDGPPQVRALDARGLATHVGPPVPLLRSSPASVVADLAEGLRRLGHTHAEAESRVRWAIAALLARQATVPNGARVTTDLDEADILGTALRGSVPHGK